MKRNVGEFPKHPLPHVPQPNQPQQPPRVQPPTIFVYERQGWEYKIVCRNADEPDTVQFYLKRVRR